MKKILIINGHPKKDSFCNSLCEAYKTSAKIAGNDVILLNLHELDFNLNLQMGYSKQSTIEPDIQFAQEKIKWAQHIVIVHPVWWGSVPALLKGFFDTTLLPGFAFKYRDKGVLWDKLLAGRTARIIYTTDTPIWIYRYFFNSPSVNQVKKRTLAFCGIDPVKVTAIGPIRKSKMEFRAKWIEKIEALGRNAA
ncbi:MAG: NAD(P)H-dependent oxidoreductase [Bacteroidota bacterium]|nr:NAD(P)H-dependent oxidoreductase [Bacteroidota bacterium]